MIFFSQKTIQSVSNNFYIVFLNLETDVCLFFVMLEHLSFLTQRLYDFAFLMFFFFCFSYLLSFTLGNSQTFHQ